MAIIKKKVKTIVKAADTHFDSLEKVVVEEQSSVKLKNHQTADVLIDPPEDKGGSTHMSDTTKTLKAKTLKASMLVECPDDLEEDETEGGTVGEAEGEQNVSTIDSDIDPAAGYVVVADDESEDDDGEEGDDTTGSEDNDGAVGAKVELENAETPQALISDEEHWDASETNDEDIFDDSTEESRLQEEVKDLDDEEDDEEVKLEKDGELVDLIDVDAMDDEGSEAIFAAYGNKLMVIKGNRIVATMNKKVAIAAGHADVYLGDQFEQVVASELSKQGLRAGLKAMGFAIAKVNVASAAVINLRVKKQVTASVADIRKVTATKEKTFQDSLAIAAVGLNRGRWKDISNPLQASLHEELTAAGVRNAKRLVHNVFAQHGVSYAKAICAMATKLAAMPQDTRDSLTASLDMTNELDDEDSDLYGVQGEEEMHDEEEHDEFEDDSYGASVMGTFTKAGLKTNVNAALLTAKSTGYSVTASDVLLGKSPLPLF